MTDRRPCPRRLLPVFVASLAALVLALFVSACAAKNSASTSRYGGGGGYDDGSYGDLASVEHENPLIGELREERRPRKKQGKRGRMDTAGGALAGDFMAEASEAPAEPMDQPAATPTAEPSSAAEGASADQRQIIYTAELHVSVYDVDVSSLVVQAMPARFGGWLQERRDEMIILRVPAERLEEAMAFVAELGVVELRALMAEDVTAEYVDLESRIRVLRETQAQLELLLERAKTVEETLEIRRALDRVNLELELALGRMRELSQSIAFSTLIVRLSERGPGRGMPQPDDPFPWVDELGVEATAYR